MLCRGLELLQPDHVELEPGAEAPEAPVAEVGVAERKLGAEDLRDLQPQRLHRALRNFVKISSNFSKFFIIFCIQYNIF